MTNYVVLLRGINVGGKNKVPMITLRECLSELGFANVATYIASGNVLLGSDKKPTEIATIIEEALPKAFRLDSTMIKVLVLSHKQLRAVVDGKPEGFGEEPDKYYSDAIFLMDVPATEAMEAFNPREGVDAVWAGHGVIYSQRLGAERTKSRLGAIVMSPHYKFMTIRSWNTVTKLMQLLDAMDK
jgi:uncharacterized protein (DUF1697 family)